VTTDTLKLMKPSAGFVQRTRCPVCDSADSRELLDLPFDHPPMSSYLESFYGGRIDPQGLTGGRFVLLKCAGCELIFQRDIPDDELLAYVYGNAVGDIDVRPGRSLRVRQGYSFQVEQLLKYWKTPPDQVEVLDYGAGGGDWLTMAAAYGCRTYAVELSLSRQDALERRGHTVLDPDHLDAGRFHFINTEQVFEHLVAPMPELQRLVAALRPGGLVRISVPNGSTVEGLLGNPDWTAPKASPESLNAVAPLEHINCFNSGSLETLGGRAGLRRFVYPSRQYFDSWERVRFIASALKHKLRPPSGTLQLFRKT
jgi:SAM-dependent methyltransferase